MKSKHISPAQSSSKLSKFVLIRWPNDKPGKLFFQQFYFIHIKITRFKGISYDIGLVYGVVKIENIYSKKLGAFFLETSNIKINEYYDVKSNGALYKNCFALGCGIYFFYNNIINFIIFIATVSK